MLFFLCVCTFLLYFVVVVVLCLFFFLYFRCLSENNWDLPTAMNIFQTLQVTPVDGMPVIP